MVPGMSERSQIITLSNTSLPSEPAAFLAQATENYIAYDFELTSWDSNNRHWAPPSNIKVWSNGDIAVYVKKLANMYRTPGIIDGGPPTSFGFKLEFVIQKDFELPEIFPGIPLIPKVSLPFKIPFTIGTAEIGLGSPLRYREERFDITIERKFPGLAGAIRESHSCSLERWYQRQTIQDAVVITPPGMSF